MFKSITFTIMATLKDNESPGCFGKELNNLLKVNNLPSICVDGYTPAIMNNLIHNSVMGNAREHDLETHPVTAAQLEGNDDSVSPSLTGVTLLMRLNEALDNNKLKFYKATYTKTASLEDIHKAFREEKAFIVENDNIILSRSTSLSVFALNKQLPPFISLKKDDFTALRQRLSIL